ncbi:MAG: sigma-70 family RNA polymerase sigma factor [Calditrichaeota bacterium]|nr:MAG: sigma-70 family RNA polymerase sigma factor [Calditrichota bacterium]
MAADPKQEVTRLLLAYSGGNQQALETLFPLVYQELRRLASGYLRGESHRKTLQTTDLVHEAYLRLVDESQLSFQNRSHFFAIAARAMRQFLVYYAKRRKASKRGGGATALPLEEEALVAVQKSEALLALDQALDRLSELDPRAAQVVELRYFSGLTIEETARALNVSPATVKRDWQAARAWLYAQLEDQKGQ